MKIDRAVEGRTRNMLGHAMRGEVEQIPPILQELGEERWRQGLNLCISIAGYIAIDVCRSQWPEDAFVRRLAEKTVQAEDELNLDVSTVYEFLTRSALGFEPPSRVFTDPAEAAVAPILITASLLLTFTPKDKDQWVWLDEIESAIETAAELKPSVYPAVVLRSQMPSQD